jgi:hypothetical protein
MAGTEGSGDWTPVWTSLEMQSPVSEPPVPAIVAWEHVLALHHEYPLLKPCK